MRQCIKCKQIRSEDQFHKKQYWCKECQRKCSQEWRERDREWSRQVGRECYAKKRDQYLQHRINSQAKRRAQKLGLAIDKDITIKRLYERDKGICQICKQACKWEDKSMDHIKPLSKQGSHTWDNIQLAHLSCNKLKGSKFVAFRDKEDM